MSKKYTIELSDDLDGILENIADHLDTSKSDVLRKSISLMNVAVSAKSEGKHFGIATTRDMLETEIIGI